MNVSEFTDVSRATDTLISAVQAFGYTAETSMDVVDLLNTIGNNYAISTADLAQSLTKSSASLVAAGGDLAEAAALTATANKIIQDADSVGTALKTTSLRLRGTDVSVLEAEGLDAEGAVTSKSKLQSKIKALSGVDILTDAGAYKSTYEILSDIADVWEDINDMDQAALLELISGKRNSSVVASILQNPEELKAAYEDAMNASGSAAKENEKYLNSIQGKIDQFNNAVQSLWQNLLGSDVIKGVIEWGTKIIKSLDTTKGKILAIVKVVGLLMAYKKINPFDWIKNIAGLFQTIKNTQNGAMQFIKSLLGIAPAMKTVTAETVANTIATQANDAAKTKEILTSAGLAGATGALSIKQRQQAADALVAAINTKQLTVEQGQAALATLGFSVAVNTADGSVKALDVTTKSFMATNPVGWILAIVSAIMMVVSAVAMLISQIPSRMEKLKEKLSDLHSEISSLESEIESLNQELETTQDRISELLAKDKLSFVEQEELDNLQKINDELQRSADLKKLEKDQKDREAATTFKNTMKEDLTPTNFWTDTSKNIDGQEQKIEYITIYDANGKEKWTGRNNDYWSLFWNALAYEGLGGGSRQSWTELEYLENHLAQYDGASDEQKKEIETLINGKLSEWKTAAGNLSYGIDPETDAWLDFIYNYEDRWAILSGGQNAKANAIKRIFNKGENSDILDSINGYVEALKDGDESAKQKIENIINNNQALVNDIRETGLEIKDAVNYFIQAGTGPDSSSVEGIYSQYQKGIDVLEKYKGNATDIISEFTNSDGVVEQIAWGDLFDDSGEIIDTQLSKALQGTDETVRTEFARIAKAVNEGEVTVENAMKSFSISGAQAGYKLLENSVIELNSTIFKDLGDEISGLIDTFDEFGSALESVANSIDLVNQAQAEMAYSGHVSVETALDLINSTEDWNKVLKIENGNITLVDGAMDTLAQSKLNQIKTNLQLALSEAQAGLEQARLAENSGEVAKTIEESTTESVRQLAANMEYLSTLVGEFLAGNFLGAGSAAAEAKANSLAATEYQKTTTTSSMSVADWEKKVSDIEAKINILDGVDTAEEFENNYSSEKVSGGSDTKEEAETNRVEEGWEKLLSEYENKLALITNERDLIESEINRMEAQGGKASSQYYKDLISNSSEEKVLLEDKLAAQKAYLEANEQNMDSDTWTEYNNEINETALAIKECEINTIKWEESLREIDTHYFEQITDEVSRLGEEINFVNGLLEDEEIADENGNWSSAALTRLGLYTQQMEQAAAEAKLYQEEIDELNSQYEDGALSEEQYQESLSTLISGQQNAIQSYEDAKDSIVEMNEARIDAIKDGIEKEIEAYEDLIDAKKEELDAERDLHDFRENIKDQTKEISELERRIAGLSGSSAASDIAERRKLEAQLMKAKEGLNDSYYDHSRDAQSQALDDEAEAYALSKEKYIEQLEEQLKDAETLIENSIMDVMLNADTVYNELIILSDTYGGILSDELTQPWEDASSQAIAWKDELKESMTSGEYAALIGEGGAITAFANGVATKLTGSWSKAQTAAQNYAGYLTSSELNNKLSNTLTGFGNQIQKIIDKWNGVKEAADKAYAAQTRQPAVGGTGSASTGSGSGSGGSSGSSGGYTASSKKYYVTASLDMGSRLLAVTKSGNSEAEAKSAANIAILGEYEKVKGNSISAESEWQRTWRSKVKYDTKYYAKGTMGTLNDNWSITDEFGDELVMYATPEGTLSYMRKGSTVVPADITANLVEWGKLNPDMLSLANSTNGINIISNAINKPEINLSFEALVKAERIDENTLPEVKRYVQQEINTLVKQMNYALKGNGAR